MKRHEDSAEGDNRVTDVDGTLVLRQQAKAAKVASPPSRRNVAPFVQHYIFTSLICTDRLDVRVVRNVAHNLRRVGSERRLKCLDRIK